jgi:hypothetical protein
MANKSKGTWYVSFELRRENEREAKKFARAKLVDTPGTPEAGAGSMTKASRRKPWYA